MFVFAARHDVIGARVRRLPALRRRARDLRGGAPGRLARARPAGSATTRGALVVAEVALALVLLVSAGLLLRSLERLFAVAPRDSIRPTCSRCRYRGPVADSTTTAPDISSLIEHSMRCVASPESSPRRSRVVAPDRPARYLRRTIPGPTGGPNDQDAALRYAVTLRLLRAMRIPFIRGRRLDERDIGRVPRAVVINESGRQE